MTIPTNYVVTLEAGQAWRELGFWKRALIRMTAPDLARAAAREAQQARALGVPEPSPRITGRATTFGDDWFGGRR